MRSIESIKTLIIQGFRLFILGDCSDSIS